jgi:hypothetical protein
MDDSNLATTGAGKQLTRSNPTYTLQPIMDLAVVEYRKKLPVTSHLIDTLRNFPSTAYELLFPQCLESVAPMGKSVATVQLDRSYITAGSIGGIRSTGNSLEYVRFLCKAQCQYVDCYFLQWAGEEQRSTRELHLYVFQCTLNEAGHADSARDFATTQQTFCWVKVEGESVNGTLLDKNIQTIAEVLYATPRVHFVWVTPHTQLMLERGRAVGGGAKDWSAVSGDDVKRSAPYLKLLLEQKVCTQIYRGPELTDACDEWYVQAPFQDVDRCGRLRLYQAGAKPSPKEGQSSAPSA